MDKRTHRNSFIAILAAMLFSGCAVNVVRTSNPRLPERAVFLDQDGEGVPVRLTTDHTRPATFKQEYEQHVHRMMDALRADPAPKGIMIVVHGGLNGFGASKKLAEEAADSIRAEGYNPIFINWRSDALDSYGEHLFRVRAGRVVDRASPRGIPASPFFLAADLGRGLTRWPITASGQVSDAVRGVVFRDAASASRVEYDALRRSFGDPNQIQVSLGDFCVTTSDRLLAAYKFPFFPIRMVAAPLADAFGSPGWDNFSRRTRNMFRQPYESASTDSAYGEHYRPGQGGASILMDSIANLVAKDSTEQKRNWRITLVGHSMGTIVHDEIVRLYPQLPFVNIVYMASASSIRDFVTKTVPYLERHPDTHFYNLTLHPAADAREQVYVAGLPIIPGGSLLEYIDDYYAKPLTNVDRMLGKWNNVMEATHLFPESIRGQITIKGFGVNDPNQPVYGSAQRTPRRHADFNDYVAGFWREDFWKAVRPPTDSTGIERCKAPR